MAIGMKLKMRIDEIISESLDMPLMLELEGERVCIILPIGVTPPKGEVDEFPESLDFHLVILDKDGDLEILRRTTYRRPGPKGWWGNQYRWATWWWMMVMTTITAAVVLSGLR